MMPPYYVLYDPTLAYATYVLLIEMGRVLCLVYFRYVNTQTQFIMNVIHEIRQTETRPTLTVSPT